MSAPANLFLDQLQELGLEAEMASPPNVIVAPWTVPVGSRRGQEIKLGFAVPPDYPLTPPSGPCISPALQHPNGAVHAAPMLGGEWVYWSRPCQHWANTSRDATAYMAHIRALFAEL